MLVHAELHPQYCGCANFGFDPSLLEVNREKSFHFSLPGDVGKHPRYYRWLLEDEIEKYGNNK